MTRTLTPTEIASFQSDGAVLIKNAINAHWVARMNAVAENQLNQPSPWANDATPQNKTNRFFTDRYLWKNNETIQAYIHESGCAQMAAQAMGSSVVRFYFDHLLIKEPHTPTPTPWHQDVPYWPFRGKQICSMWVALTKATVAESSLEFVRGSHRQNKLYRPAVFGQRETNPNTTWTESGQGEPVPPIEANRSQYDIIGFDVEPGDGILFSAWVLHGSRGNSSSRKRRVAFSTRWLGDDVTWEPREGVDPTVQQTDVAVRPGEYPADDAVFPCVWRA